MHSFLYDLTMNFYGLVTFIVPIDHLIYDEIERIKGEIQRRGIGNNGK